MSITSKLGQPFHFNIQLFDGNASEFPLVHVYNQAGTEISGSPFTLTHLANGLYRNLTVLPPNIGFFDAVYIIYNDAGHTIESTTYGRDNDLFNVVLGTSLITGEATMAIG